MEFFGDAEKKVYLLNDVKSLELALRLQIRKGITPLPPYILMEWCLVKPYSILYSPFKIWVSYLFKKTRNCYKFCLKQCLCIKITDMTLLLHFEVMSDS